ncbi:Predicted ATPase [Kaistia soli DSM 19436]|uniref:Predicted ATPase n=1 Tax=Kaistia soli DSM 19436 TaxID=1122133 RepID=A0A1M4ZEN4_9HYPH|nr:AAA family ATPase [Kaistia soli]SHF16514.1 Predicted ATPase [Kaistia soli DSM 19436]
MFDYDDDFASLSELRERFVMISGCSGGGKSTLLEALALHGFAVQREPGRQIVREQLFIGGDALPWADAGGFLRLVLSRAMHQLAKAAASGRLTLFDRGLVDAYAGFRRAGAAVPAWAATAVAQLRYADTVFMAPPWPEIFVQDADRRHDFDAAEAEYHDLWAAYESLGYLLVELPRSDVESRVSFVVDRLGAP